MFACSISLMGYSQSQTIQSAAAEAMLTYNPVCSSLAPCQRAWGPAAKCEFISAPAL